MARRHVVAHFKNIEDTYLQTKALVAQVQVEAQAGNLEQSVYEEMQQSLNQISENYQRIAYIMMLLNIPNKKTKKMSAYDRRLFDAFENNSAGAVEKESADALANVKKLYEKVLKGKK